MSRLPVPEIVEVRVEPSEDVDERKREFCKVLLTAIHRQHIDNKKNKDDE